MRPPSLLGLLALTLGIVLATPTYAADELGEKGRDIFKKNQRAVVTVQVVIKMKMSMGGMSAQENESKEDVTGTVVDPSGLTVLALSSIEPNNMLAGLMGGMGDEDIKMKIDTELTDLKFLLDDGAEIPGEVVLRDKDLDLAFVRPKTKPATPMVAVDLSKPATAQILDQVITLNRLGTAAGRAYSASVERISAIVQKPRTFYIPDSTMTATSLGSPAFGLDGNILGIFVMRTVSSRSGQSGSMSMMFGSGPTGLTSIIIPADAVLKAAKQAPEAKGEEPKK